MIEEKLFNSAAAQSWKKIGVRHHHGINVPLFSLLTEESSGIGEYLDLFRLIDFCHEIGFDVIQLLPLNDSGQDASPYNAISAFALSPLYLSLRKLPNVSKVSDFEDKMAILKKYNSTPRVRYEAILELKKEFLYEYYSLLHSEISQTEEYKNFVQNNPWLEPYALFKTLKELHHFQTWDLWPSHHKSPSINSFKDLVAEHQLEIQFHIFLQFFCFQQLEAVKKYAEEKNVFIKGDIPILISRDSADVWQSRDLFHLHLSAGAPPDMYSQTGQSWGFPVYDWEAMGKNNFAFWRQRLALASHFYHIYRLDHAVGFYRIWAIPLGKLGNEGNFVPSEEHEWLSQGEKIMKMMLESSSMLPIAEDLGTVPPVVRQSLRNLGIPGTKVIRWERRWNEDGGFISASEYYPESMTTVSTHDSDTLQLWWKHSPKEAQIYCNFKNWDYKPFLSKERHYEILKESHQSSSLFHINLLSEYLALFPELCSPNPYDERINIPGKVLPTNWTYRIRYPIEKLASHPLLTRTMRELKG